MHPPLLTISSIAFVVSILSAVADTVPDPVQAYAKLANLSAGRVINKWTVDLNNDGRKEILLAAQDSPEELNEKSKEEGPHSRGHNDMLGFLVYVPNANGSGYTLNQGTGLSVDLDRCYVGKIAQLNKWGVVSVELFDADEKHAAGAIIFAYTLEGDHLKVTDLTRYDPSKGKNAIFDQYLSKEHRTPVKPEQITLP